MATATEPVLSVSVEALYAEDVCVNHSIRTQRFVGRTRLVIEGEDAIVAVLHDQAMAAAELLRGITRGGIDGSR